MQKRRYFLLSYLEYKGSDNSVPASYYNPKHSLKVLGGDEQKILDAYGRNIPDVMLN